MAGQLTSAVDGFRTKDHMQPTFFERESKVQPQSKCGLWRWSSFAQASQRSRPEIWIVHGLSEHAGRYRELATWLCGFGVDVLIPEGLGHGWNAKFGGQRLGSCSDALRELIDWRGWWTTQGPLAKYGAAMAPWSLVGHSWGGLLCLAWLQQGTQEELPSGERVAPKSVFLSSPALALKVKLPLWKQEASRWLKELRPQTPVPTDIHSEYLSSDVAVLAEHDADPLLLRSTTPMLFESMLEMQKNVLANPMLVELPVAIALGQSDPLIDPEVSKKFYNALSTKKKLLIWDRMRHEVFNEIGRREVYEKLAEWVL